jgi:hypothetical protein
MRAMLRDEKKRGYERESPECELNAPAPHAAWSVAFVRHTREHF